MSPAKEARRSVADRPTTARLAGRGRDGAATRARIEAEALRLFAEKGVDRTSVRDIAQAVGVAEGALYRHFPSKEALARSLFLSRYGELAARIGEIRAAFPDLRSRLAAIVTHACRLFDEQPALFAYLLLNQHDHLGAVPEATSGNLVEALAVLLGDAVERGEIPPQNVTLASALALGCLVQPAAFVLYGRLAGPLSLHAEAIAAGIRRVLRGEEPD
ncbi:TetR/AcrR family transcriptional regulator [Ancylobacter sp. 6x-1]|uniref:TetR/AcrR family transcriptional regulator n=1 Tax=Ancylobacter crimeensis TaxID=2579147 RepID=A0ABT0D7T2_9HYPH|nr:TetR/AcrR family transcriptional regulator [Ancylobacter crimeensis]MCK0196011.1 TetR/AcrR family transcriptional regulator [Ancylobacter crimeensis]